MDIREKIARIIFDEDMKHGEDAFIDADAAADAILQIPAIKEALVLWGMATEYSGPRPPTSD